MDHSQYDSHTSSSPVQAGEIVHLDVERLGESGDGLCRVNNYVVWVPGALAGEKVVAEVVSAGRKHGRAEIHEIEETSTQRADPECPHFGVCGGCQIQHLEYRAQLEFKTGMIRSLLRHALCREEVPVHPCIGPEDPWGHRNRIALQVTEQRGQLTGGLFRRRSRELVDITKCPVSDAEGWRTAQSALEAARAVGIEAWNPVTDSGTLRTVLVRTNVRGESEVTFVLRHHDKGEVAALSKADIPSKALCINLNDGEQARLLGYRTDHLRGERYFSDVVAGNTLRLSPGAWMRTSHYGLDAIASLVQRLVDPIPEAVVLDLYSGVGVLGLAVARSVKQVIGMEQHPRAVEDATASAKANNIDNISFRKGNVEKLLHQLKMRNVYAAILDPPPEGCGRPVINTLAKEVRPERLVYVSQTPASFVEEVPVFEDRGYRLTAVHPVDTSPHTAGVELVALFESSIQGGKRRATISQARRLLRRLKDG